MHFFHYIEIIVARGAVRSQTDDNAFFQQLGNRRDAAGQFQIAAGIVGDTDVFRR